MACFLKRNLKTIRYVVEDDGGVLHIASERQLLLAMPKAPGPLKSSGRHVRSSTSASAWRPRRDCWRGSEGPP